MVGNPLVTGCPQEHALHRAQAAALRAAPLPCPSRFPDRAACAAHREDRPPPRVERQRALDETLAQCGRRRGLPRRARRRCDSRRRETALRSRPRSHPLIGIFQFECCAEKPADDAEPDRLRPAPAAAAATASDIPPPDAAHQRAVGGLQRHDRPGPGRRDKTAGANRPPRRARRGVPARATSADSLARCAHRRRGARRCSTASS